MWKIVRSAIAVVMALTAALYSALSWINSGVEGAVYAVGSTIVIMLLVIYSAIEK